MGSLTSILKVRKKTDVLVIGMLKGNWGTASFLGALLPNKMIMYGVRTLHM